jgi:hypothetical protein
MGGKRAVDKAGKAADRGKPGDEDGRAMINLTYLELFLLIAGFSSTAWSFGIWIGERRARGSHAH